MERISTDTLHFSYQPGHPLGSPFGGAVTEGDGEGIYTLSVLAALSHLFQGERQGSGFLKIWANSLAFSLAAW
jgi:hypothetical protein